MRLVFRSSLVKRRSERYSANTQSSVPGAATADGVLSDAPPVRHESKAGKSTVSARCTAIS